MITQEYIKLSGLTIAVQLLTEGPLDLYQQNYKSCQDFEDFFMDQNGVVAPNGMEINVQSDFTQNVVVKYVKSERGVWVPVANSAVLNSDLTINAAKVSGTLPTSTYTNTDTKVIASEALTAGQVLACDSAVAKNGAITKVRAVSVVTAVKDALDNPTSGNLYVSEVSESNGVVTVKKSVLPTSSANIQVAEDLEAGDLLAAPTALSKDSNITRVTKATGYLKTLTAKSDQAEDGKYVSSVSLAADGSITVTKSTLPTAQTLSSVLTAYNLDTHELTIPESGDFLTYNSAKLIKSYIDDNLASEVTRAKGAEAANAAAVASNTATIATNTSNIATNTSSINAEVTRAKAAEKTNANNINAANTAITSEITRAKAAEKVNADAITAEATRAAAAELAALDRAEDAHNRIDDIALVVGQNSTDVDDANVTTNGIYLNLVIPADEGEDIISSKKIIGKTDKNATELIAVKASQGGDQIDVILGFGFEVKDGNPILTIKGNEYLLTPYRTVTSVSYEFDGDPVLTYNTLSLPAAGGLASVQSLVFNLIKTTTYNDATTSTETVEGSADTVKSIVYSSTTPNLVNASTGVVTIPANTEYTGKSYTVTVTITDNNDEVITKDVTFSQAAKARPSIAAISNLTLAADGNTPNTVTPTINNKLTNGVLSATSSNPDFTVTVNSNKITTSASANYGSSRNTTITVSYTDATSVTYKVTLAALTKTYTYEPTTLTDFEYDQYGEDNAQMITVTVTNVADDAAAPSIMPLDLPFARSVDAAWKITNHVGTITYNIYPTAENTSDAPYTSSFTVVGALGGVGLKQLNLEIIDVAYAGKVLTTNNIPATLADIVNQETGVTTTNVATLNLSGDASVILHDDKGNFDYVPVTGSDLSITGSDASDGRVLYLVVPSGYTITEIRDDDNDLIDTSNRGSLALEDNYTLYYLFAKGYLTDRYKFVINKA